MAQANIEMMHALIQRLLRAESLKESVTLKPNELMFLTKAVQGLTSSRKAEVDTTITAEAAAQEAALQQTLTSGGEAPGMKVIFEEAGSKFATEHDFEQSAAASETPGESEVPAAEAWPEAEA